MKAIGKRESVMSALDWVLQQDDSTKRRDDEFTLQEYVAGLSANGIKTPDRTALNKLEEMVKAGKLQKRKLSVNGCFRNVYSKA